MSEPKTDWHGDNPYCLVIVGDGGTVTLIDLDERGWATTHAALMRTPGRWILARKADSAPVFSLVVADGEQPYFTMRNFKPLRRPEGMPDFLIRAWGIGKKRRDGHVDRLWLMANGIVCAGDDVGPIGDGMVKEVIAAYLKGTKNGSDPERRGDEAQGEVVIEKEDPHQEGAGGDDSRRADPGRRGQEAGARRGAASRP